MIKNITALLLRRQYSFTDYVYVFFYWVIGKIFIYVIFYNYYYFLFHLVRSTSIVCRAGHSWNKRSYEIAQHRIAFPWIKCYLWFWNEKPFHRLKLIFLNLKFIEIYLFCKVFQFQVNTVLTSADCLSLNLWHSTLISFNNPWKNILKLMFI